MKKLIKIGMFLLTITSINLKGQMLTDTAKYHTKIVATSFMSSIELESGNGEMKLCQYMVSTKEMTEDEIKLLSNPTIAATMNVNGKYSCKNTYSWIPRKIFIYKGSNGKINGSIEGSAENAYGSRGSVVVYLVIDEKGNMTKLGSK
jgi:hypothetical protein